MRVKQILERPILWTLGLLMSAIVALAVTAMLASMFIAQINRGMAAAVNQSGTLRMQSYRVGMALADTKLSVMERHRQVLALADGFERRLKSSRLTDALPASETDPVRRAYERVRWRWAHEMRHALAAYADSMSTSMSGWAGESNIEQAARYTYLSLVDAFVDEIHALVLALEERAERRTDLLRLIQVIALVLIISVVLVTMWFVKRRVMAPLAELLDCADRVRQRDFSGRTRFVGEDELGRLGAAMNLMTLGLYQIYNELEEQVEKKTRDLARTNHSLELLYRTSRSLNRASLSDSVFQQVLEDVRGELKLAAVVLCLDGIRGGAGGTCIGTGSGQGSGQDCSQVDCALCEGPSMTPVEGATSRGSNNDGSGITLNMSVGDSGRCFGTLRVALYPRRKLEAWQRPLLESLAGQLATALDLQGRIHESRRLVLHEERSILARELHDSMAQSLAYLNIQAARLGAALGANPGADVRGSVGPVQILDEIRDGIRSTHRQLRELLSTFRLKIDGRGLSHALADTVLEFRGRGDLIIELDERLTPGLLSPNEEVHVLQIVREALSNVVRHARASHCWVIMTGRDESVDVLIGDDGVGLGSACLERGHYGMTIMRERAVSLGGTITMDSPAGSGAQVRLHFRPRMPAEHVNGGSGANPFSEIDQSSTESM